MTALELSSRRSWTSIALLALTGILAAGQTYVVLGMVEHMAADMHVPRAAVPTATTVFGIAYALGFLAAGPLASRFGSRRVLLLGLGGAAAAAVAAGMPTSFTMELVARAVQGVLTAAFAPCALVWIAQRIAPGLRVFATSAMTASFFASIAVLPLIARPLADMWGWRSVFFAGGAALAVCALLLAVVLRPDHSAPDVSLRRAILALPQVLRSARMLMLLVATTAVLGSYVAVFTALQLAPSGAVIDFPGGVQGLRLLSLAALIVATGISGLARSLSPSARAAGGFILAAVAAGVVAGTSSPVVLAAAVFVFVAAVALTAPALIECILGVAGPTQAAGAMAWYGAFTFLGGSIGPLLAAVAIDGGLVAAMGCVAPLTLVGALLVAAGARRDGASA